MRIPRAKQRGMIPLWCVLALLGAGLVAAIWWTRFQQRAATTDGRETIIFWGHPVLGDEIYAIINQFEQRFPQYKVIMSSAAARDLTGDGQRLLCAIVGQVPPDVVFFDRFAIGEWASRGALTDLTPLLESQAHDDLRIDLDEYYEWTVAEASYAPPGTNQPKRVYGVPSMAAGADVRLLFINCDLLRQAGFVDERGNPRPPRDWDELQEYGHKLTVYRTPGDKRSGIVRLGCAPNVGNSWFYMYSFLAGGQFMNDARDRITFLTPPNIRALRYMTEMYDELGGYDQVRGFQDASGGGAMDPFVRGTLAMKIDGDANMNTIADWRPNMDFMLVPPPLPPERAGKVPPVSWSGGYSWVVPATAKNKEGGFRFIQFLNSWQTTQLMQRGRREQKQSEGRLYLPSGLANRVYYERLVKEAVEDNPDIPEPFKRGYQVVKETLPHTSIRPVTPIGQYLWQQQARAFESRVNHRYAAEARATGIDEETLVLRAIEAQAQARLDSVLKPPPPREIRWRPLLALYALLVALPFVGMYILYCRRKREYGYRAHEVGAAMLFASPWIIGFIVLVGGPILFSIVISLSRYDVLTPARFVGLDNYAQVARDPLFHKSIGNTAFMLLRIPLALAVSLGIAMLLNRAIRGIGIYRAAFYLPAIMPIVASSILWLWMFNPSMGGINTALRWLFDTFPFEWIEGLIGWLRGAAFEFTTPSWIYDPDWAKPSLIIMHLWVAGAGMIIWLAGLQSIPQQLYEAASIDGAGAWRRFAHITIPMLSPYILFNLIIGIIGTMQIFAEAYIVTAGGPDEATLFYSLNLFWQAFRDFRMGYASALAWILFVLVLSLTLMQLWLSKRWVHYERA